MSEIKNGAITPTKLIELGFKEVFVDRDTAGGNEYTYYHLAPNNLDTVLISDSDDENDGGFTISLFTNPRMKTSNIEVLVDLVNTLNKMK